MQHIKSKESQTKHNKIYRTHKTTRNNKQDKQVRHRKLIQCKTSKKQ